MGNWAAWVMYVVMRRSFREQQERLPRCLDADRRCGHAGAFQIWNTFTSVMHGRLANYTFMFATTLASQ